MKTSNINTGSNVKENTSSKTLSLKNPLCMDQEAKIKSFLGKSFQKTDSSSLHTPHIKFSQQDRLQEALDLLRDLYPKSFTRGSPKPLKIGIDKDIIKKGFWPYSARFLRRVLSFYANSKDYQQSLFKESYRYSLEGNPVGSILDYHKNIAYNKLQLMKQQQGKQDKPQSHLRSLDQAEPYNAFLKEGA